MAGSIKQQISGIVVECLPYRQYRIKMDSTGRLTLRNRRHIRPNHISTLVSNRDPLIDTTRSTSIPPSTSQTSITSDHLSVKTAMPSTPETKACVPPIIRRSTRNHKVPVPYQDYVLDE